MNEMNSQFADQNEPSVGSFAIRYGLILGFVLIILSLISMLAGLEEMQGLSFFLSLIVYVAAIVMALKAFKSANHGFMSYGQGVGLGTLTCTIAGVLSGVFTFIYVKFIDNSIMQRVTDQMELERIKMEDRGMSQEQIDQAMEWSGMFTTPLAMMIMAIIGAVIMGLILSLIISAIMKNNRPEFV